MAVDPYVACAHNKRLKPDMTINKELADAIGCDYRVMPIFEKGLYEYNYKKYYSLNNNEYLRCRWQEYVKHFENKVFTPFQFVDTRDFHFYNGNVRLLPSASIHKKTDFRLNLKPGPGVDVRGERPIPNEIIMKRGDRPTQRPEPLRKRKGKDASIQVGNTREHSV